MNLSLQHEALEEEQALGFHVWVAELELVLATSRSGRKPDAQDLLELLQKVHVTIDRSDRAKLREHQRKCEDALSKLLLLGAPPPVRC